MMNARLRGAIEKRASLLVLHMLDEMHDSLGEFPLNAGDDPVEVTALLVKTIIDEIDTVTDSIEELVLSFQKEIIG
jgi:hypothetical protein